MYSCVTSPAFDVCNHVLSFEYQTKPLIAYLKFMISAIQSHFINLFMYWWFFFINLLLKKELFHKTEFHGKILLINFLWFYATKFYLFYRFSLKKTNKMSSFKIFIWHLKKEKLCVLSYLMVHITCLLINLVKFQVFFLFFLNLRLYLCFCYDDGCYISKLRLFTIPWRSFTHFKTWSPFFKLLQPLKSE